MIGLDKIPAPILASGRDRLLQLPPDGRLGMAFIVLTLLASFLRWRGTLFEHRWLLRVFVFAVIGPIIANEAGWAAAEVGRQPWIVHPGVVRDAAGEVAFDQAGMVRYKLEEGLLTRNGVSESVKGGEVLASIVMFSVIYALLFAVWIYVLNDKIQHGPHPVHAAADTTTRRSLRRHRRPHAASRIARPRPRIPDPEG